jgi:PHS family inorganic phosphate transporter-like MFS transporter
MMATVFFMQPLGQLAGNIVSLVVIAVARSNSTPGEDLTRTVAMMWRWVIAIGVVPGAVATLFRHRHPRESSVPSRYPGRSRHCRV